MVSESVLAAVTAVLGVVSFIMGLRRKRKEKPSPRIVFRKPDGDVVSFETKGLSSEDIDVLISTLSAKQSEGKPKAEGESGKVSAETLLLLVPGIIALLFAITFVVLLLMNQSNQGYATPKELSGAMTMIIGYYFGIGTSRAVQKGHELSAEQVAVLLKASEK